MSNMAMDAHRAEEQGVPVCVGPLQEKPKVKVVSVKEIEANKNKSLSPRDYIK